MKIQCPREVGVRVHRFRIDHRAAAKQHKRFVVPVQRLQQRCQLGERFREIGIQRQDATVSALGRFHVTAAKKRVAQIEMCANVIGFPYDDVAKFPDRIFECAGFQMHHTQIVARRDLIGIERERPLVSRDRLVPTAAVLQYVAEVAEIERVSRRGCDGLTQQRNRVVEARFTKRDEPGQV